MQDFIKSFKEGTFLQMLRGISQKLQTGDTEAYCDLHELLKPIRDVGIFEFQPKMSKSSFTILWLLIAFVFDELENSFGGDSYGFPIQEGKPLFIEILKNLGYFIESHVVRHSSSISNYADALATYGKMIEMINKLDFESCDTGKDWMKL